MSKHKIALTGATGFIGRRLLAALLDNGHSVVSLHRRSFLDNMPVHPNLTWEHLDTIKQSFASHHFDATIHLATAYGVGHSNAEVVDANITMPLRLLELATEHACPLFVSTDTFFAKPEFDYSHMQSYILSKRHFEAWARLISENVTDTKIVNARLEHVYGPGDGSKKFVPHVLTKLLAGEPLGLTPGDQLRDFVYVDDVVKAYLAILRGMDALPAGFTEAQVGTGEAVTVRNFVQTAQTLCHSPSVIEFAAHPHRDREIMRSQADTRVLRELGWQAHHGLSAGIEAVLKAMATGSIQFSHSIQASASR